MFSASYTSPYVFAYEQSNAVYVRSGYMGQLEDCIYFSLDTGISIVSYHGFLSRATQPERDGARHPSKSLLLFLNFLTSKSYVTSQVHLKVCSAATVSKCACAWQLFFSRCTC
jgi:hypothetical protein